MTFERCKIECFPGSCRELAAIALNTERIEGIEAGGDFGTDEAKVAEGEHQRLLSGCAVYATQFEKATFDDIVGST